MKNFILTLQFLTRIPINVSLDVKEENFIKGVKFFPIVGLIIGLINLLVYMLCSAILHHNTAVILAVLSNIMITGALHIDGLADTCDGIFSARKRDRMLEIMKDSRIGTNGAVGIIFDLALRISLLLSINEVHIIKALLLSPVMSRTFMVVLMHYSVYARPEGGLGNMYIGKVGLKDTVITAITGVIISVSLLGYTGVIVIALNLFFILLYKIYITSKLGGMTGDTLGAGNEIIELSVIMIISIIERYAFI
jgi:adenosylcobinamide-GDP ribazoletransferase